MKFLIILAIVLTFACATVQQADLDAWVGQPQEILEQYPIFLTMPVIKTQTSDGMEIWNFINGRNLVSCSEFGNAYTNNKNDYLSYNAFTKCMSRIAACNNIFYIKDRHVMQYNPIGTGGARCYRDERVRPKFRGASNYY